MSLTMFLGGLQEGLFYALLAMGVYISFRILNTPDLTTEGSYTLGVAVSAVLLWLLRPVAKKYFTPKLVRTNVDAVIGTEGIVTAEVDNLKATGTVKLGALEWSARSTNGEPITPGTRVRVDRVEGVKAYVTPVDVNVTV